MQEVERLVHKAAAQAAAEQKAAAQAQGQAAEKQRATREDSANKRMRRILTTKNHLSRSQSQIVNSV
jgi:hypothetical protein